MKAIDLERGNLREPHCTCRIGAVVKVKIVPLFAKSDAQGPFGTKKGVEKPHIGRALRRRGGRP